ncbi:4365_t:CDS:1, partial [Gigaspora rosea]
MEYYFNEINKANIPNTNGSALTSPVLVSNETSETTGESVNKTTNKVTSEV